MSASTSRRQPDATNVLAPLMCALCLDVCSLILSSEAAPHEDVRLVESQAWRCWQCTAGPETIVEQHELVLVFLLFYARHSL